MRMGKPPEVAGMLTLWPGPRAKSGMLTTRSVEEATAKELQQIPHVGPTLAGHIIEARDKKPFQTVDDLLRVPGIKAKTLENLRPYVTVDPAAKVETHQ